MILENIIKISTANNVNVQLKKINIIKNSLVDSVNKTKEKFKNLLKESKKMNLIML